MRMHGLGLGLWQVELTHLSPHIRRHELNGCLHLRHHACRFIHAIHARITASFLMGDGTDRVDLVWDIARNQRAVTTVTSIQVDEAVRVADGPNALAHRLPRLTPAVVW